MKVMNGFCLTNSEIRQACMLGIATNKCSNFFSARDLAIRNISKSAV